MTSAFSRVQLASLVVLALVLGLLSTGPPPAAAAPQASSPNESLDSSGDADPSSDTSADGPPRGAEVVALRTRYSKTFRTDQEHTLVKEIATTPLHYRDASDRWRDIDTTLVADADGARSDRANASDVTFAPKANAARLASLSPTEGGTVAFGLAGAQAAEGVVDGSSVTYANVLAHTDIRFTALPTGVKEDLILRSSEAPRTFDFSLSTAGLTVRGEDDGSVSFRSSTGETVARIPRGWMVDSGGSTGVGAVSAGVRYSLHDQGQPVLRVTLDDAWLDDPSRVYPVTVDPSVYDWDIAGDTYISDSAPDTNFSTADSLRIGLSDAGAGTANKHISFLKFHELGVSGDILSAKLRLYNNYSNVCEARRSDLRRPTSAMNPATVTWNTRPSLKSASEYITSKNESHGNEGLGCANAPIEYGVTQVVRNWTGDVAATASWPNYGLELRADVATDPTYYKTFPSKDAGWGEPRLIVTYDAPYITEISPPFGDSHQSSGSIHINDRTPLFRAKLNDRNYPDKSATIKAQVNWGTIQTQSVLPGSYFSWEYPDSLPEGLHVWHIWASRANWWWQPPGHYITVDVTPPTTPTLSSTTHTSGQWSGNRNLTASWPASTDKYTFEPTYEWAFDQSSTTGTATSWQPTSLTSWSKDNVGNGSWWLHVRAVDKATNKSGVAHFNFKIESPPDTPRLLSPPDSAMTGSRQPTLSASYNDADVDDAGFVDFQMRKVGGAIVDAGGKDYHRSVLGADPHDAKETWPTPLADGAYEWRARAFDEQLESQWSAWRRLTVDTAGPEITAITADAQHPENGWSNDTTIDFSWSASDPSGIRGYSWAFEANATAPDTVRDAYTQPQPVQVPCTVGADGKRVCQDGDWWMKVRAQDATDPEELSTWGAPRMFLTRIDTVKPTAPTIVTSTTHPVANRQIAVGSSNRYVKVAWDAGTDERSGIAGYRWVFNKSPDIRPNAAPLTPATQLTATSPQLDPGVWYFHVVAEDHAGNISADDRVYGPIIIDEDSSKLPTVQLVEPPAAMSDESGLEQFAPFEDFDMGQTTGYVHLRTGNVVAQQELASIPGQGLNTVLRVTHNSQRAAATAKLPVLDAVGIGEQVFDDGLGRGWSLSVGDLEAGMEDLGGAVDGVVGDLDINAPVIVRNVGRIVTDATSNEELFQATGRMLTFTDGDGTTHRFVREGGKGSRWQSPPGVSLRVFEDYRQVTDETGALVEVLDAYRLVRPDGVTYTARLVEGSTTSVGVGSEWRIQSVTDRRGNELQYVYKDATGSAVPVDPKYRVFEIHHSGPGATRRIAKLSYETDGRLKNIVTLPDEKPRNFRFNVDADSGELRSITQNPDLAESDTDPAPTDPVGTGWRRTRFTYDDTGYDVGQLDTIIDPRGAVTDLLYKAGPSDEPQLAAMTDRAGQTWRWHYGLGDPNSGEQTTTSTTPLLHDTKYQISGREPVHAADSRAGRTPDTSDRRITGGNVLKITLPGLPAVVSTYQWEQNRLIKKVEGADADPAERAETRMSYNDIGMVTKVVQPPPNRADLDLPAGAPTDVVENLLRYDFPPAERFGYATTGESACAAPLQRPDSSISTDGWCRGVAELVRTSFATNYAHTDADKDQRRVSDFRFDADGNLVGVVQRATPVAHDAPLSEPAQPGDRVTRFAYYKRGGLARIDGPRPDSDVRDVTCYGVLADRSDCGPDASLPAELTETEKEYGGFHASGMPLKLRDALVNVKHFEYTPYGMTSKVVDRDGGVTQSYYDARDNLVRVTDPIETVKDPGGGTAYTYDRNDNKISETSPRKIVTTFDYDALDRVKRAVAPGTQGGPSVATVTTYFPDGTVQSEDGPRQGTEDTTRYEYWPNQNLKKVTAPAGTGDTAVTEYAYDALGRRAQETAPAVNVAGQRPVTSTRYTPQGSEARTASTSAVEGQERITEVAYNAHGEPIRTVGPRQVTADSGAVVKAQKVQTYDAFGQTLTSSRKRGADGVFVTTEMGYDIAGNQIRVSQPFRKKTSNDDTTAGRLTTEYEFDAVGQLTRQKNDPVNPGHWVQYHYSGEGQQTKRIDKVTGYSAEFDDVRRVTTYEYNADNTRSAVIVRDNDKTGAERFLATCNTFADGTSGYDLDGNLLVTRALKGASSCDPTSGGTLLRHQSFTYDDRNFIIGTVQRVANPDASKPAIERTQTFEYHDDGAPTKVVHKDGVNEYATTYANSPAGWTESITDWRGKTSTTKYLPSGAPQQQSLGGSGPAADVTGDFAYHRDAMISSLSWKRPDGTVIRSHTGISYDVGGLRTGETVSVRKPDAAENHGGEVSFRHDLMDRLISWTSPFPYNSDEGIFDKPTIDYELDDGGNIERQVTRTGSVEREVQDAVYENGRLQKRSTIVKLGADALSQTTTEDTFTYSNLGEEEGRVSHATTKLVGAGGVSLAEDTITTTDKTGHDAMGHTASNASSSTSSNPNVKPPPNTDVSYVYDTADRLLARTEVKDGKSTTLVYFYWGESGVLAEEVDTRQGATKVRYLADGDGQNIAQQSYSIADDGSATNGKWTWLLPDSAANVATLLRDTGDVVEQKAYDPYGKPEPGGSDRKDKDENNQDNPKSSLGFQAAHTDETTGNVLLGARQYDPTTARFTTPDVYVAGALDLELGTDSLTGNRYLFAASNPVAFFEDGHGLFSTLGSIAKAAVPFIPVVSTAVDVVSAATGRDILDGGRKMSGAERAMALGSAAVSLVPGGSVVRGAAKTAADVASATTKVRTVDKVGDALQAGASKFTRRASSKGSSFSKRVDDAPSCSLANSFVAGTPILLANGTTKPIEDVDVGDVVLATDPETGETTGKPVTQLIEGTGEKQLVELTIDGETIVATDGHPFYSVADRDFVDAVDLDPGDVLRQPLGASVIVTDVRVWSEYETVYNFTVGDYHTYYAGLTHLLVHNCGNPPIRTRKQLQHIKDSDDYRERIARGRPPSYFFGEGSGERLTRIAYRRGTINNRGQIEYDFGFSVGVGPRGGMQTRVTVRVSKKGIHGHPSGPQRYQ